MMPLLSLPSLIDFKESPSAYQTSRPAHLFLASFNCAPEVGAFLLYLQEKTGVEVAIETGTWKGITTAFFSCFFKEVHTIELSEELYQIARESLEGYLNIKMHLGDSVSVLRSLLPTLIGKPLLFYLDAHGNSEWPLLGELEEISKTHRDNCIIVIDDFKVPGRKDILFDYYGGSECSYEYIQNHLERVFTEYTFTYLIPKDLSSRAKFVVLPKQWAGF